MTFSCFRMATFRPATRKYATFHALRVRLLIVVSLPGGAKGRHAKTRQNHNLACFRVVSPRQAKTRQMATFILWSLNYFEKYILPQQKYSTVIQPSFCGSRNDLIKLTRINVERVQNAWHQNT